MKKILLLIGCLILSVNSANALTLNDDNSYTNSTGANFSKNQYEILQKNFTNDNIDNLSQESIDVYSDPKLNDDSKTIYQITTYKLDGFGNVVDEYSMKATKEQAEMVAINDNIRVSSQRTLVNNSNITTYGYVDNYTYETESKRVTGYYSDDDHGTYVIQLWATWLKTPKIKQFDIMAVRWNNSVNVSNIIGWQECDSNTKKTDYYISTPNTKYTDKGAGISMNIHDSAKNKIDLYLRVESNNYFGYDFYGTYQHARHSNANTLAISQSYSFGNGLGGVLVFNNNTYKSYYDDMQGIKYHYEA